MDKVDRDLARRIEEDHRNLHSTMDDLDRAFEHEVGSDTFAGWKMDLLWKLRDFHNQLQKHFDLEEEGGYNEDLIRVAPHLSTQIAHLEEDHRKIISDLNHILEVLKSVLNADSPKVIRVEERVSDLVTFIRDHECKEHAIIQEAYFQDYGVGD